MELHRPRLQLPLAEQIGLIRPKVGLIQLVGWPLDMSGELLNGADIRLDRRGRVVATLKLVQHRLSEMGHRHLLVTHNVSARDRVALASDHAKRPPRQRLRSNAVVGSNRARIRPSDVAG